jgi:hypothetical protein
MIFYRLQSEEYDVNSESRSFWSCYDDMEEAMEEDIKEWIIGFEPNEHWIDLDNYEIDDKDLKEEYDKCNSIKYLWNKMISEGNEARRIHDGISCYDEDRQEELRRYFEYHRRVGTKSMLDAYGEGYYILVFEGEYVGTGLDGEDLAIFEKEIKRMTVKEFIDSLEK